MGAFQIPGKLWGKTTEIDDFDPLTLICGLTPAEIITHLFREGGAQWILQTTEVRASLMEL